MKERREKPRKGRSIGGPPPSVKTHHEPSPQARVKGKSTGGPPIEKGAKIPQTRSFNEEKSQSLITTLISGLKDFVNKAQKFFEAFISKKEESKHDQDKGMKL